MSNKMTLRKIAAELDISQVTVLRALAGRPGVSVELREKILHIANHYKYKLPNHRTGNIAIVVPNGFFSGYLSLLTLHLNQELSRKGLGCYFIPETSIANLNDCLFDGLICTVWNAGFEKRFPRDHALPLVCINAKDNRSDNVYSVVMDEASGIRSGMELLYRFGRRRIVFLATPDSVTENVCRMERVMAYHEFCREHDIHDENLLLVTQNGENLESNIDKAVDLNADAVFHANEDNVFRIYERLRKHGKRIPEDISILGLELDSQSEFMDPPLTTLRQNFKALAENGVKMLTNLISGKIVTSGVRIPYQLIERNSISLKRP